MKKSKNKIYVALNIFSDDISPERITGLLGINCDDFRKKGWQKFTINSKTGKRVMAPSVYETNIWKIGSNLPNTASLERHISGILKRLHSATKKIKKLSEKASIEFSCTIYWYEESTPPLNFEKKFIRAMSDCGASLDVDLYMLYENEN